MTWALPRRYLKTSKVIPKDFARSERRSVPAGGGAFTFRAHGFGSRYGSSASAKEIMLTYLERKEKPIKPITVKSGPCKENILLGDDLDLLKFPSPLIHGGDGGRYIGTWHTVITKDPDSSWVNWGMYRLMVHDRNTLGCLFPLQQHIARCIKSMKP